MVLWTHESGSSSAPAIVFLHGGGVSSWMWEKQIAAFEGDYHVLAPDLPGHGRSPSSGFSMSEGADEVAALIRERAGGSAHVVGLSLGAQVAALLLATAPALVKRAILSGTLVRPINDYGMLGMSTRMYWPFRNASWLVRANMSSLGIPAAYEAQFAADTREATVDGFLAIMQANMRFTPPPELHEVHVATLVVVGEKERKIMHESARNLLRVLPEAQGAIVRGHNHNWSLEAPDLFNRMVRAWITATPLPSELEPLTV